MTTYGRSRTRASRNASMRYASGGERGSNPWSMITKRTIALGVGILRCEAKPLAPPLPAGGERSDSERSEGIRVRGRSRESELADKPPHPICFASQRLRSQIDLSPHAGRGGARGTRLATSNQRAICDSPAARGERACPGLDPGWSKRRAWDP